jgi:UDP-glucose 4-epimerase
VTRRVVVTGITGNVGTALHQVLSRDRDIELVGVTSRPPPPTVSLAAWHGIDLGSAGAADRLATALEGADAVVHLAWRIQPSHDEAVMRAGNVDGTQAVLDAVAASGVPHVVHASSVGAYSPGPKDDPVDESWPTEGIGTSAYSRHKADAERRLDEFEVTHPDVVVTRLRPGLIFQRGAASEILRYFAGPFVPGRVVASLRMPRVPLPREFVFQAVHAADVADAYAAALRRRLPGAFNVAADPVLGPDDLAAAFGGRPVRAPVAAVRAAAAASWRLHLQPTAPGWVDLAAQAPVMSTERARTELEWRPRVDARHALVDLIAGVRRGISGSTAPLRSRRGDRWRGN